MRWRGRNGWLVVLSVLLLAAMAESGLKKAHSAVIPEPQEAPASHVPGQPAKYALLVGINNYKYADRISPLAGSLNDVEEMRQVLIGKFEFSPDNIVVLKDSQATHAAIISAIQQHLIAKARAGDIVVFHYSGHGSQMKDVSGKMISGLDETIVPYDSRDPEGKVFDISGSELHGLLVQLAAKTTNLTFILDSCHSGTLVRGARVRSISADTRTPPAPPSVTRGVGATDAGTTPKFAFISAASSKESAFENYAQGEDHGALTYALTRQLRNAKAGATYRDIMDGVIGDVNANYPSQHPSLEGAEADQHVFGDGSSLAHVYITASPSQLDSAHVTLSTGEAEGATVGSTYDVYPPGSRKFAPPEKPTARVRISSGGALSSEATMVSGDRIAPASRAVERIHRYGNSRMRVFFDGPEGSPAIQSIRDALQSVPYIEIVDKLTSCNMQVRQVGNNIQTLAADSTTLSPPVAISDSNMADRVASQLKSWAKWFNVLSIHNGQSGIDFQFTIKGSQTRDPMARVGKPDMGVLEGELIEASITNNSERDLYVSILDLSSDGSINVVYPSDQGAKEVLKPGATLSRTFGTTVPKGRSTVTDILKAFASFKPIDLSPLDQGQIRDIGDGPGDLDPLQALLMDSTGVSRGLIPVLAKPLDLGSWITAQRVLVVRRNRDGSSR